MINNGFHLTLFFATALILTTYINKRCLYSEISLCEKDLFFSMYVLCEKTYDFKNEES